MYVPRACGHTLMSSPANEIFQLLTCNMFFCLFQTGVIRDIVIGASPSNPPLSVLVLSHLLSQQHCILHHCHVHSSASGVADKLTSAFGGSGDTLARNSYQLAVTLIWKKGKCIAIIQNVCNISRATFVWNVSFDEILVNFDTLSL